MGTLRNATMPATLEVAPGFGVAWDPQQLFKFGTDEEALRVCFGATHTERYANMIEAYLKAHSDLPLEQFVEKFGPWMSLNKYGDALQPHLPPPQYAQQK